MADLIDRQAFRKALLIGAGYLDEDTLLTAVNVLDCAHTIDAEPVVRCKDCKWRRAKLAGDSWHEGEVFMHRCEQLGNVEVRLDDFCSYGERRGEDG